MLGNQSSQVPKLWLIVAIALDEAINRGKVFRFISPPATAVVKSENSTQFGQTLETVYLFICLFINTPWQPPTNW